MGTGVTAKASYNKTLSSFHDAFAAVERTMMIQHMLPRSPVGAVLFVGTMLVSSSPFDSETTSPCTAANLTHMRSQLFDVKLFPNGVSELRSASHKRNVKTDSSAAERSLKQMRVLVAFTGTLGQTESSILSATGKPCKRFLVDSDENMSCQYDSYRGASHNPT